MKLIGISGKKRSGKDTLADSLVHDHGFTRLAFADAMRAAALVVDPIIGHTLVEGDVWVARRLSEVVGTAGWEAAKANPEVRRTLQHLGSAVRELDPGFWVRITMAQAGAVDGPVVITDVRMPNEATAIEAAGGLLVRLERPGLPTEDAHITETALDDWPFTTTIHNDRDVVHLHAAAADLTRRLS